MRKQGRTSRHDVAKLIAAFHNFAKRLKTQGEIKKKINLLKPYANNSPKISDYNLEMKFEVIRFLTVGTTTHLFA
jgi:hypothetical protein